MKVHLVVLDGKHVGRRIQLPPTQFVIGRDPRCHLRPASADVSRFHCAIATSAGQLHVRDLKSRNGTWVNGRRITGAVRISDGDVLEVGPLRFEFRVQEETLALRPATNDGELSWLVRSPSPAEHAVLDPSARTIAPVTTARGSVSLHGQAKPVEELCTAPGAVAGEFLRDYLKQRRNTRETA